MLSEELISNENPMPVRAKFRKVGMLQYISHLDLQRTFEKVIVRSGIPAWYTQGFNPHAKMVFALPLPVGTQSECEYLDIKINRDMPFDEIKERLNGALTDELRVLDVYAPQSKFADIVWAEYELTFFTEGADVALTKKVSEIFKAPLVMSKRSKSGDKDIDITPLIHSLSSRFEDGKIVINTMLSAFGAEYLNPEMLVTALRDKLGFLSHDLMKESYTVVRKNVFLSDGVTVFR